LDGTAEACPFCGAEVEYLIYLENDKFISTVVNTGKYNFIKGNGYYIILEE
jgi:hypothetical protein